MGVVVAHCTVDLAQVTCCFELRELASQARDDIGDFLAHGGRARGLAVGAGEHRGIGMGNCQFTQGHQQPLHGRQQYILHAIAQHQRVGEVVDVLGGAGKVHEFSNVLQLRVAGKALLDEILNRLDVVVGGGLNGLDALCICFAEVTGDGVQRGAGLL